jgi:DNA processing protein
MDELHAWLAFASVPGLHAGLLNRLSRQLGSIQAVSLASPALLESLNVRASLAARIASARQLSIDQSLRWLEMPANSIVTADSTDYPPLLAHLDDAPSVLFVRGDVGCLRLPQLAIVGSRNPTPAGRETAESFAAHLARTGLTVTSGLALGVDAAGHRGALKAGGKTIAVCGTGLDIIYPREHESLAQQIASSGALVSEFAPGVQATRLNFPRRNRLISGLSLGTLVVEAALRSGSLITARLAAEQGREIFAIPGSIHNALSKGCHQLIRQGAQLVETAQDIFDELAPLAATLLDTPLPALIRQNTDRAEVFSTPLDKDYKILLDAVGFEPAGVDLVIHRTGFKADEVASMLLILELQGLIESYPGGLYIRARPEAVK